MALEDRRRWGGLRENFREDPFEGRGELRDPDRIFDGRGNPRDRRLQPGIDKEQDDLLDDFLGRRPGHQANIRKIEGRAAARERHGLPPVRAQMRALGRPMPPIRQPGGGNFGAGGMDNPFDGNFVDPGFDPVQVQPFIDPFGV